MSDEKRRYERFDNRQLSIDVARTGLRGFIRANPSAECTNFSRTGMQFDCPSKLHRGEKILIDLSVDDIAVRDLRAEVVDRHESPATQGDWCYGVRFCLEDADDTSRVFHQLLLIEDRLKRQNAWE